MCRTACHRRCLCIVSKVVGEEVSEMVSNTAANSKTANYSFPESEADIHSLAMEYIPLDVEMFSHFQDRCFLFNFPNLASY
mmetsp:Transcript_699/g.1820  ORF Transcript_699/g.1820 Transcript_699/m.1820 type:complete len:81 (+) Transcript_699:466-708(+)